MKRIFFVSVLLTIYSLTHSQTLSDKAEISVLTLGPWHGQLYTAFGHSAFRVYDPVLGIDDAYNYGVFDYDKPNFYLDFARGQNYYMLGVADYPRFEYVYIYYDRYVHEQQLNLSKKQKQRLFEYLKNNARPENREYLYDYFYDNCATKIPAVIKDVFGDSVKFSSNHITSRYSIRELTDLYLQHQPWGDLGIDICLGLPMDKKASPYEYMFLPDYVEAGFDNATIEQNGIMMPLVKRKVNIYESKHNTPSRTLVHPLLVFTIVFVAMAVLSYRDIKSLRATPYVDAILFGITGAIGVVLLLLWVATDHKAAAKNLNLLWALPSHLIAVIAFIKQPKWLRGYFLIIALLCLGLLIAWSFLPQQLHYALIPFVMALAIRAYTQYLVRKPVVESEK